MGFSWWTWSALMVILLAGFVLMGRAVVIAVRRDGMGRGRPERGTSAPWWWAGLGLCGVSGALMILWIAALDG
ncbi:hypothetical protein DOU12_06315 [Clavibacter michiganensis subsp. michiganensis]|nr:hypothetical protein [Clavibacter michiganensis subsp. michiganensis]